MQYKEIHPSQNLQNEIHSFWELRGDKSSNNWERIFPDGCPGLIMNLGDDCTTDNGTVKMEHGKTYVVGAMTTFKESYINEHTHLVGVCLKPSVFASFFSFTSLSEIKNNTILFDKKLSFDKDHFFKDNYTNYLNHFFTDRKSNKAPKLSSVLKDIKVTRGLITIHELSKQNGISTRQLERLFNNFIGLTPKEYANIIRLQHALNLITSQKEHISLLDIAFECGYYDHSHLTNAIKRYTGYLPSEF